MRISSCLVIFLAFVCLEGRAQDFGVSETLGSRLQRVDLKDSLAFQEAIDAALLETANPDARAEILLNAGTYLVSIFDYEKADPVLQKCLEYAEDQSIHAEANFQAGLSLMYRDIRIRSLKKFEAALDLFTTINDSLGMGKSLDKIADSYNYIGEHEKARPYYDRCIEIFTAIRDTARLTNVLGNIGGMLSEEADDDSAIVYYNQAIRLNEMAGNLSNLSSDLAGLGIAVEGLGRLNESLIYYHRALRAAQEAKDEEMEAFAYQHLGYHYFNRGNPDSAEYYMSKANDYARRTNYAQLLINTLDVLHQTAYAKGNYLRAYDLLMESKALGDSLMNLENVSVINSLRSEYETQALLQQADLREQVIEKQRKLNITLIVGAILLVIGLIALLWLNQKRRKKNEIIQRDKDLIQEQAKRLQDLDQSKSIFFANISHDIRAPVSLINGFVQLLKTKQKDLSEESKEYLHHIEATVDRLSKMTEEINQLIQLEENRYQLTYAEININEFFGTLGKMFESSNQYPNLRFAYQSEVEEGTMIRADKSAMEKIVFNVVGNAFKYNTTGTRVELKVAIANEHLVVTVVDDGEGIQEERIERIFDRYYRTEKGSKAAQGQGIGLSLVKDLVELHGGKISVDSVPNKETTFKITLPLSPEEK